VKISLRAWIIYDKDFYWILDLTKSHLKVKEIELCIKEQYNAFNGEEK